MPSITRRYGKNYSPFEVDILRNDVCDISLNLQLTERVLVSTDGSVSSVEAVAEPDEPEEMWTVKRG
ncbi:phage tail protein [Escherichia coli]|uniref:Phage tail protein n=1 Tax=Escherichia coli TaxID=562 RepID=A0A377AXE1_ECOLX|nr:phage tail protein [Escherichia coli]